MSKSYYDILGVSKSASSDDLKKAYRKLAMQYHPDKNPGDAAAQKKFQEINEAYDTLKDTSKRSTYDRMGHDNFKHNASGGGGYSSSHAGFGDFEDIFEAFGFGGRSRRQQAQDQRGSDLQYNLTISLEEAFAGKSMQISFRADSACDSCNSKGSKTNGGSTACSQCRGSGVITMRQGFFSVQQTCNVCGGQGQVIKDPCSACHGQGRVEKNRTLTIQIPQGVEHGSRLRKAGEGGAGLRGNQSGDLYIVVGIKQHKVFEVEGANLHRAFPVSFTTAILGDEIECIDIEGKSVSVKIPPGTQYGDRITVKDKGMTIMGHKSKRGDMVLHVDIHIPKNLTSKQIESVKALHEQFKGTVKNSESGFLNRMKNLWK